MSHQNGGVGMVETISLGWLDWGILDDYIKKMLVEPVRSLPVKSCI